MSERTFALRSWLHLLIWPGLAVWAAIPVWLLVVGLISGELAAVIAGIVLGLLVCVASLDSSSIVFRSAARVSVDEEGIEGRPLLGKRIRLGWDEIAEVRDLSRPRRRRGDVDELLLVGADGRRRIAVGNMLPRFEELAAEIDRRTPNARRTRDDRPFWKRQVFPYLR